MADAVEVITTDKPVVARLASLDGLRGVASFVVLLSHMLRPFPEVLVYENGELGEGTRSLSFWLIETPLHLFWEGTAAVYVFFVLSGYVLSIAVRGYTRSQWIRYYPRRLARLYLPVWGSVLLTTAVFAFVKLQPANDVSYWINRRMGFLNDLPVSAVVKDMTLLVELGGINRILWSLRVEVIFSLLLPLVMLLVPAMRKRPIVMGGSLLVAMGVCMLLHSRAVYLPVFGFGMLLAIHDSTLRDLADRVDAARWGRGVWVLVALVSATLLTAQDTGPGVAQVVAPERTTLMWNASPIPTALGAFLMVFLARHNRWFRGVLSTRLAVWLGTISFSLYLIHEPLIRLAVSFIGGWYWWSPIVTTPVAVAVGWAFYRVVERPSVSIANRIVRRD